MPNNNPERSYNSTLKNNLVDYLNLEIPCQEYTQFGNSSSVT